MAKQFMVAIVPIEKQNNKQGGHLVNTNLQKLGLWPSTPLKVRIRLSIYYSAWGLH